MNYRKCQGETRAEVMKTIAVDHDVSLQRTWWLSFKDLSVQLSYDMQKRNDIQARTFVGYLTFNILMSIIPHTVYVISAIVIIFMIY